MTNLDQIQSLEQKVIKAVELINRLREENTALRARVKSTQPKIVELETIVNTYKQEQEAIEKSILNVLSKLDRLEDEVSVSGPVSKKEETKTVLRDNGNASKGNKAGAPGAGKNSRPSAETKDELDIF
jgi:chromosome segregation ATPase